MTGRMFIGIDVAFAKKKRLPVCAVEWDGTRLAPLLLKAPGFPIPPAGSGNVGALNPPKVAAFAVDAKDYLADLEAKLKRKIGAVAIDAPSAPCLKELPRRDCERAMDRLGLSCFATPTEAQFEQKCRVSQQHLDAGGAQNRLPNANQLWMLVGFELFRVLESEFRCMEVYPYAIAHALGVAGYPKSTVEGHKLHLAAAAKATGNDASLLGSSLTKGVYGSRHDRLDAFLSAWVAASPDNVLTAYGHPPGDVIWCPAQSATP